MQALADFLERQGFCPQSITLLKRGRNQTTYAVVLDGASVIAHIGALVQDGGSSLQRAFHVQSFLVAKGMSWVPAPVLYDQSENILLEQQVGVRNLPIPEMTVAQLDTIAQQFSQLHAYTADEVHAYLETQQAPALSAVSDLEQVNFYGVERFKEAEGACPDQTVLEWIKPRLQASLAWATSQGEQPVMLHQGDIGNNFRIDEAGKLYHIDWEFADIATGHELAYIKIHSLPTAEQFSYLCESYSKHSGIDIEFLQAEVEAREKIIRLNDVIWAAMKWGRSVVVQSEAATYKELTYKRIRLFEKLCEG